MTAAVETCWKATEMDVEDRVADWCRGRCRGRGTHSGQVLAATYCRLADGRWADESEMLRAAADRCLDERRRALFDGLLAAFLEGAFEGRHAAALAEVYGFDRGDER